jgi:hypothetical protein
MSFQSTLTEGATEHGIILSGREPVASFNRYGPQVMLSASRRQYGHPPPDATVPFIDQLVVGAIGAIYGGLTYARFAQVMPIRQGELHDLGESGVVRLKTPHTVRVMAIECYDFHILPSFLFPPLGHGLGGHPEIPGDFGVSARPVNI